MLNFISALFGRGFRELELLRRRLVVVIAATFIGVALLLFIKPTISQSFYITLAPWLVSACFLFSIKRLVRFHIAGESVEFLQALSRGLKNFRFENTDSASPTATKTETMEQTGAFDNEFIRVYLSVISNVFLVQTALFLLLPLYVNYTVGGNTAVIIIAMLLTVIAIDNFTSFRRLSRFTVKAAVIAYAIGLVIVLVPQVGFYANQLGADKINIVPQSSAKIANEINQLRAKQREEQNNARLREGLEWQRNNPGQELPQLYKEKVEEAGKFIQTNETHEPPPVSKPAPEKKLAKVSERRIIQSTSPSTSSDELDRRLKKIYGNQYANNQ